MMNMNKEALPLITALLIPISLVILIFFYYCGYDITIYFRDIPLIYYIIIFPIGLGLLFAMIKPKTG